VKWQGGEFAEDAVGDWWLCLPVKVEAECSVAPEEEWALIWGLKRLPSQATAITWKRVAGRAAMPEARLSQRRGHNVKPSASIARSPLPAMLA